MNQPYFSIRGVVEGFYGVFYTQAERDDLIRFLGQHGYNLYIYAPKNDRFHRSRWREPYPAAALVRLGQNVQAAQDAGVTFCYALSPGLSICYSSDDDFRALTTKLKSFFDLGVRTFSLFLDDILPQFRHPADFQRYASYADAHVDLCNRILHWLRALDPTCTLSMCPTDYAGIAPFSPYLHTLGAGLDPAIDVFYTGPQVCSATISTADAEAFGQVVRREPLIWDNYPVNDGGMAAEMHIGPIHGRSADLGGVVRGIVVNPMNQAEASKVALATFDDYFRDPHGYDPDAAWKDALCEVAGKESYGAVRLFADNSLRSCLHVPDAAPLQQLVEAAVTALQGGGSDTGAALDAVDAYLSALDDACYHLTYEMDNARLRNELIPWLELLELWVRVGQRSLKLIRATARGESDEESQRRLAELLADADRHPKHTGGEALRALAAFALQIQPTPSAPGL